MYQYLSDTTQINKSWSHATNDEKISINSNWFINHSQGISISLGAVALGACLIEKHFTYSKKIKGPDISASMDPIELSQLIKGSKEIFFARGGKKQPLHQEKITMKFAFASVVSIKKIFKGERLTKKNIWVKRPGTGYFQAADYFNLIGTKARETKWIVK